MDSRQNSSLLVADFPNLYRSAQSAEMPLRVEPLFDHIRSESALRQSWIVSQWWRTADWRQKKWQRAGGELVTVPDGNDPDATVARLLVSAADSEVGSVWIASGDGDFIPLAHWLDGQGLEVRFISYRNSTARDIMNDFHWCPYPGSELPENEVARAELSASRYTEKPKVVGQIDLDGVPE